MKILSRIGIIVLFLVCGALISVKANAAQDVTIASAAKYTVVFEEGKYKAYLNTSSADDAVFSSDKLSAVIDSIGEKSREGEIYFSSIVTDEDITLSGLNYTLSGRMKMRENASLIIDSSEIRAENFFTEFDRGALRLKSGNFNMRGGEIFAQSVALKMDYSSDSMFLMHSGSIIASCDSAAVEVKYGTFKMRGGSIKNTVGAAIKNSATLIIIGDALLEGIDCEIYSSSPITLSENGIGYKGKIRIRHSAEFKKGEVSIVAYGANKDSEKNVTLIDASGKKIDVKYYEKFGNIPEKDFLTAYIPYKVTFGTESGKEIYCLSGEEITFPDVSAKRGYTFLGWKIGGENGELYETTEKISDDLYLYPAYKLSSPTFSLSSLDFVYDGYERYLCISELEHPLLSEGVVSYKWYKDGKEILQYTDSVPIRNVADSGKYKCVFTFSYKADFVTVETPSVNVSVHKKEIKIPTVESAKYNGEVRVAEIYSISLYEVESVSGINAGVYPFKITLRDPENYKFENTDAGFVTVDFVIEKADNEWIELPSIKDFYDYEKISVTATSKFGTPIFLYSINKEGPYSEDVPVKAGKYYVKAEVSENANYHSLSSEPISFSVIADEILSLYIVKHADRRSYTAFDTFSLSGLSVAAGYRSGRREVLDVKKLNISYNNGNVIFFGDSSVSISYGGKTLLYPIEVSKAEYDISNITFTDFEYEYSAKYFAPEFLGKLPVGKDGIPLCATVIGGGTDVGAYALELRFFTESENYEIPQSLSATLNIRAKYVDIIWENESFVYDGKAKEPSASYVDAFGRKITLSVMGARTYAGKYSASAVIDDSNYIAKNPSFTFEILKADYDLSEVFWSAEELIYNGTEQRVFVSGLPSGVSVIGYVDNKGEGVGEYTAFVALDYDKENYNAPNIPMHKWRINQAEYDISSFYFSDAEYVYDGEIHFPLLFGEMPIGVDGSTLGFRYIGGISEVSDGKSAVLIEFYTDSPNYKAPTTKEYFVTVLPKGINAVWSDLQFLYDESLFSPTATAEECELTVIGATANAGKHIATAKTLNANYYVINAECEFEILKAENSWSTPAGIKDIYTSGTLSPTGKVKYGNTEYIYSTDKVEIIEEPKAAGVFYFKASSTGDENHLSIESEWIRFQIIEVVPIAFLVEMLKSDFLALDKISDSDINITLKNNDSSTVKVSLSDVEVSYNNGDVINIGDTSIKFSYLGFETVKNIAVYKRDYDLSDVRWEGIYGVYNGEAQNAVLTGLPEGVSVVGYIGNGNIDAGLYVVSAKIDYDSINYNKPEIADAIMNIEKQTVAVPDIDSSEYNGKVIIPPVEESQLYYYTFDGAKEVGVYTLRFYLNDPENYRFERDNEFLEKTFEITKRRLVVQASDVESYYFEKYSAPTYMILSGELLSGEDPVAEYKIENGCVFVSFAESNYEIEVYPGRVIECNRLSDEDTKTFIIILCALILGTISVFIIILNRKRILLFYKRGSKRRDDFIPSMPIAEDGEDNMEPLRENESKVETKNEITDGRLEEKGASEAQNLSEEEMLESSEGAYNSDVIDNDIRFEENIANVIDAAYADSVITDSLAKNLIRKDSIIETYGNKRQIINVDTLSRSFSSGERVDVNLLKKKNLIPYDTGYIKVLSRGIIDKPLDVYANDFSLSAVKMIALTGGKAIKAGTAPTLKKRSLGDFKKKT